MESQRITEPQLRLTLARASLARSDEISRMAQRTQQAIQHFEDSLTEGSFLTEEPATARAPFVFAGQPQFQPGPGEEQLSGTQEIALMIQHTQQAIQQLAETLPIFNEKGTTSRINT